VKVGNYPKVNICEAKRIIRRVRAASICFATSPS